jgi:hypothetical protein
MDLQEVGWGYGLNVSGLGTGHVVGTFKRDNDSSGSITCGECTYVHSTIY